MKIPQILAQEPAAVPQGRFASAVPETGLALIGQSLTRTGDVLAEAADAKRKLAARTEAALRKSEFDVGLATLDSNLRLTHSDPDAYLAAYTQGVQQLHATTLQNTQSEEAKALLGLELTRGAGLHLVEAQKHYNSLYVNRAENQLDATLDNKRILLGTATTDQQRSTLYREGIDAVDELAPILGKHTTDRKIKWRNEFLMDVEGRAIEANPEDWTPQRVRGVLPDDKIKILQKEAETGQLRLDAKRNRIRADFDRSMKEQGEEAERRMVDIIRDPAATIDERLARLQDFRHVRLLSSEKLEHFERIITEGPNLRPSDPDTLSRIGLDAHSTTPTVTEAEVDHLQRAHQRGGTGLNFKDAIAIKDRLRTTRNTLEQQGESQLVRDQNQAEQELRATLGIRPGILSEALKDDPIARLYGAGLTELRRRSRLFQKTDGGTEEPLAVLRDLLPRLQQTAGSGAQLKITEIRGLLTFPTRQALDAARAAGQISQAQYEIERSRWLQIDDIESRIPLGPPAPTEKRK